MPRLACLKVAFRSCICDGALAPVVINTTSESRFWQIARGHRSLDEFVRQLGRQY